MTSSWTPPLAQPPYVGGQPVPPPPRRRGRVVALVAAAVALVAATAGVMYTVMRPTSAHDAPTAETAGHSATEQADATKRVCDTLNDVTRGLPGKGGVRSPDNQINVPVVVRLLTGVVAIQDGVNAGVPAEVYQAANNYVRATLALLTAGNGVKDSGEVDDLTDKSNEALFAFFDVCGIPHK